ncbi:hypothetical protein CKW47_20180, partial [Bordetella pertussis]
PLTSITKTDAQVRGGETRQDYKDTRRFPLEAPSNAAQMRKEKNARPGAFPLPRSLTRYARSFDCGERYLLTQKRNAVIHRIRG